MVSAFGGWLWDGSSGMTVSRWSFRLSAKLCLCNFFHGCFVPNSKKGQSVRLKKNLTKLILETSGNDWKALLPFSLFRVRNTPGKFKLTPYEILYGGPPPLTEVGRVMDFLEFNPGSSLFTRMKALEVVRNTAWKQLKEVYEPGDLMIPHQFQVGDAVLVWRHRAENLKPC